MLINKMWCDVLTKPKQEKGFRINRSHLMNVAKDYDDEAEQEQTNLQLLPKKNEPMPVEGGQPFK